MALQVITVEDFEQFAAPLLQKIARLEEEVTVSRILLKDHHWISRTEAEILLDCNPDTLKRNREKWEIKYRKGKRFVEYWLPDIWKYLKEVKHLKTDAIERRIQVALHSQEAVAA